MHAGRLVAPLALLAATAVPALADERPGGNQLPCTRLDHLSGFLAQTYGEKPVSAGLQANGQLLQIFASQDTGTWTAVTTSPAGLACVVATGRGWEQAPGVPATY
jgi:hypothetical protein